MDMLLQLALLVLGFVMLIKGADWFVDGASSIATKFGIPQLVIGLTIVAMGTSAPEAAVSITAALKGNADITIGNVVGSNILNVGVILGVASVITSLAVAKSTLKIEMPFMIAVTAVLLGLGFDKEVSRIDGVIIIVLFIAYLSYLFVLAKKGMDGEKEEKPKTVSLPKSIALTIIGFALIILGSDVTVDAATKIATMVGLSERIIGLTIVALGTSLPELCASVVAARKKNADIAIGNIVGSNLFNILFVVGISALITPVPFIEAFRIDTLVAIALAVVLLVCSVKGKVLKRWGGIVLLLSYVSYFVFVLL